jgi:hypothetical protein
MNDCPPPPPHLVLNLTNPRSVINMANIVSLKNILFTNVTNAHGKYFAV